jgi:hypothetical protein
MSKEAMKRFLIETSVENAEGSQTWYVDATSEDEALKKYEQGGCDLYASNVDVTSLGEPEISGETTLDDFGDFAEQPAQQEYASFAEWAHDYVQDNLHKLKPAQRTWVGLTDERIESVRHMRDVQGYDGNWNYDPYMQGLYNGLEFALSLLEVREPQFKDAPETWLGDIKVKYKLSSETEAKLRSKNEDRN